MMRVWLSKNALLLLLIVIGLMSCASKPELLAWTDAVLVAERKLQNGDFSAALVDFESLEQSALFRSDAVEMSMRQAEVHRRAGEFHTAEQVLDSLEKSKRWVDREQLAKIVYLRGRILHDSGLTEQAQKYLMRVVNSFPKTAYGWRAWVFLKPQLEKQLTEDEFLALCRKMFRRHRDSPIADNFMYEAAHRYFQKNTKGGNQRALELYQLFLDTWIMETSGFWDDVVWELSLLYHRMHRYKEEEDALQRLLATREPGWPSSSDLKTYKYAYMRIAKLHMFEFNSPRQAAKLFHAYEDEYPTSIFRDDMIWWEGHAWLRAGDTSKAKAAWARLAKAYPESKYLRRIRSNYPAPTAETPIP